MSDFIHIDDEQIAKYTKFRQKLLNDLDQANHKLKALLTKYDDYMETQQFINANVNKNTKMNIGANTFLDVEIINPKIVLLIGMNIFIEVTYEEAFKIIPIQLVDLNTKIEEQKTTISSVEQYLNQVEEILLQFK